jgi:diguanylate cyclase (GGDEF)-like protein
MNTYRTLIVLLACRDAGRRAQLTSLLDAAQYQCAPIEQCLNLHSPDHVGLVISDAPWDEWSEPWAAELMPLFEQRNIGLIAIGWSGPADVVLPTDVSERELLNCVMLVLERVRISRLVQNLTHQQQSLVEQALVDVVTGLPNRRAWEEQITRRVEAMRTAGRGGCLAIFDLDHFKRVNDQRGHATGDQVLQAVGQTLRSRIRQVDFVARLGGDEFGLLVDGLSVDAASAVLERIRRDLLNSIEAAESLPPITASLGYVLIALSSTATTRDLFDAADRALGRAKAAGRDQALEWKP